MHFSPDALLIACTFIFYAGATWYQVRGHGKAITRLSQKSEEHDQQLVRHDTILKMKGCEVTQ